VKPRILVVEDERAIQIALSGLLGRAGYEVSVAGSGKDALALLEEESFDLVLTDLALGAGPSGMDVLACATRLRPESAVVMITAHGSEKIAVEAMKAGAVDYVPKPFDNDEIRLVVARALDRTRLARENRLLLDRVQREYGFENLIGAGAAMQRVFEAIQKVAETDLTVLVRGESGTGKELVAQALHQRSPRRDRPFVAVNCAAISAELVESELFGHEKGAFTGADARRAGRFEAADGGTIFLDEIGDMAPATQAKVLRVIQERSFERVGGRTPIEVDVRVVAATHRHLEQEVARGAFREDLYYRLRVVEVVLPPLRERREDIPALALRFLAQVNERHARSGPRLGESALAALARHAWPGNVRELRNAIEQAAVLASGPVIGEDDLRLDGAPANAVPAARAAAAESAGLPFAEAKRRAVERFERAFLLDALRASGGNISRAAEAVGMVRQSLQQKIRELGLRDEDWRSS
jgi:DNA-binding NtrC family response regulator